MAFSDVLADFKQKLQAIPGIKTIKVGIEANLSPADYPMIRLVPTGFRKGTNYHLRICDLYVYVGLPLIEGAVSVDSIYDQLLAAEEKIVEAGRVGNNYKPQYIKTIVSDHTVSEHYKLCCIIFEIVFDANN